MSPSKVESARLARGSLLRCLIGSGLLFAGCPEDASQFEEPFDTIGPVAFGGRVAFVDRTRAEVHLITPALGSDRIDHDIVEIGRDPQVVTTDLDAERLLVLTHGSAGAPGVEEEEEALWAIEPDGATTRYEVGSPFTAIGVHPDGDRLFLYFDQTVLSRSELVYNPHEVATVDLSQPPSSTNPSLKTVRSFEMVPTTAIFSPPLQIAGETLDFVAVLASDFVTLVDLDHPDRREVSIPLTLDPAVETVLPLEVVFSQPDPSIDPVVYVSAQGSTDVFAFTLRAVEDVTEGGHFFSVAPNLYAVGAMPTDLEPVTLSIGEALLVATGTATLWVIDTATSEATAISLEAPVQRIVPVLASDGTISQAILFASGGSVVHFAQLAGLEDSVLREVDAVAMAAPVGGVSPLPDFATAAVFHADANRSVSIVRLADHSVSALTATAPLDRTVFSADGARAFVAASFEPRISVIDVASRHPEDLRLDEVPTGLLLVPGPEILVVTHEAEAGLVTFIDANQPSRATARMLEGFLLEGILDRNGEIR